MPHGGAGGTLARAATLLLAEVVWETRREPTDGSDGHNGHNGHMPTQLECVHVIDAAMICGDDVRRLPYAERYRRAALMVDGLTSDVAEIEQQFDVVRIDAENNLLLVT